MTAHTGTASVTTTAAALTFPDSYGILSIALQADPSNTDVVVLQGATGTVAGPLLAAGDVWIVELNTAEGDAIWLRAGSGTQVVNWWEAQE